MIFQAQKEKALSLLHVCFAVLNKVSKRQALIIASVIIVVLGSSLQGFYVLSSKHNVIAQKKPSQKIIAKANLPVITPTITPINTYDSDYVSASNTPTPTIAPQATGSTTPTPTSSSTNTNSNSSSSNTSSASTDPTATPITTAAPTLTPTSAPTLTSTSAPAQIGLVVDPNSINVAVGHGITDSLFKITSTGATSFNVNMSPFGNTNGAGGIQWVLSGSGGTTLTNGSSQWIGVYIDSSVPDREYSGGTAIVTNPATGASISIPVTLTIVN